MNSKDLRNIASVYEAVYGGAKKVEKKDTRLVVTAADKKANTKAYQNYKAGNKAYKAADHLGEESVDEGYAKPNKSVPKGSKVGPKKVSAPKGSKVRVKRWWDDDGDGIGYEKGEVKKVKEQNELVSKEVKDLQKAAETGKGKDAAKADKLAGVGTGKKKGHDCASKVKHEEYGFGNCIKEMHTLDEDGNVSHYDVMFESKIIKNIPVSDLEIIEGMYHEHAINHEKNMELQEKQKDTPDQVAAVIDMYRSKKGTGEAVKDTEEGKKAAAKKERDYAAWERSKMKKDDPDWKHKKGSTTESVDAEYIETVQKVKAAETEEDIKRWKALEESGNFTAEEIETIKEADIADILARLEKKRISKGGDPDESPLGKKTGRAMKSQQDKARKKAGLKVEHHQTDADGNVIPHEEIDESSLVKKLTRPVRKAKRVGKRLLDTLDSDPGRAHTIGTLGNPNVKNEDERARQRKNQKKYRGVKVKEEVVNELKTSTLRSYANRASIDAVGRGVDAGIKGMTGPKDEMEKNMTKAYKRQRGINTAVNKLASRAERKENFVPESTLVRDILTKKN